MGKQENDTFVPFTKPERIEQLGSIDKDIVSLLRSTGRALQALGKKESQDGSEAMADDGDDGGNVFEESTDDFMRTLRRVNVGMKRQIWGLQEAGIVTLRKEDAAAPDAQGNPNHQNRLEPDGDGKIGGFDVGWLNSRGDQVERELELELWTKSETFLQQLLDKQVTIPDNTVSGGN